MLRLLRAAWGLVESLLDAILGARPCPECGQIEDDEAGTYTCPACGLRARR